MKIGKKVRKQIVDEFENALSKISRLESVEFWKQREMAIDAAIAAIRTLEAIQRK